MSGAADRRLLVATALVVPALLFVVANMLEHRFGVAGAASWLDPALDSAWAGWLVSALVAGGPLVALAIAATRLFPIRRVRDGDAWEVRIRVRADRWAIGVAAVSVALAAVLAVYLIVENLPCLAGLAERC
jgi:hypothetical protein